MNGGKVGEALTASAERLRALADRVAALRDRARPPAPGPAAPLFSPGAGGTEVPGERDLHFQVDDAEGGKRP